MTVYKNFVVHIDYNEKGEGHIIVEDTETGTTNERRVSALSFENLVDRIGWEAHLALTDWMVNP